MKGVARTITGLIKRSLPRQVKRGLRLISTNIINSLSYYFRDSKGAFNPSDTSRIVFLCKGNICRSAFADVLLKRLLHDHILMIDSCGLEANRRARSPLEALQVAAHYGVDLSNHVPKQHQCTDITNSDIVLVMEVSQLRQIRTNYPEISTKVLLLRRFAPVPFSWFVDIHDPYSGSLNDFRYCFWLINVSLINLSMRLRACRRHA